MDQIYPIFFLPIHLELPLGIQFTIEFELKKKADSGSTWPPLSKSAKKLVPNKLVTDQVPWFWSDASILLQVFVFFVIH